MLERTRVARAQPLLEENTKPLLLRLGERRIGWFSLAIRTAVCFVTLTFALGLFFFTMLGFRLVGHGFGC